MKLGAGRAVGLGSVRLFDLITSRAFRVKGRRRRFWPRSSFLGLHQERTFSVGGRSSAAAAEGRCSAAQSEVAAVKPPFPGVAVSKEILGYLKKNSVKKIVVLKKK